MTNNHQKKLTAGRPTQDRLAAMTLRMIYPRIPIAQILDGSPKFCWFRAESVRSVEKNTVQQILDQSVKLSPRPGIQKFENPHWSCDFADFPKGCSNIFSLFLGKSILRGHLEGVSLSLKYDVAT